MAAVSVQDQLKALLELQKVDGEIYRLRRQLEALPAETALLKEEQAKLNQAFQAAESRSKTLEMKRHQMEMDLNQRDEQIRKLQGQLYQIKTNKEYSAMQKEIEGAKADKSVLEEEILKLMEEGERIKGQVTADRELLKLKEADLTARMKKIEETAQMLESSLQTLRAGRVGLTPRVEPAMLSQYERILERREGLALAPIRGDACGGCHMNLPPQTINEVQMGVRLVPCEACARILYIEPSE